MLIVDGGTVGDHWSRNRGGAMADEMERIEMIPDHGSDHRLAKGLIAGVAIGVGLGMLLAPRRGAELRKQIKDATGHWAHRGHDVYNVCRDKIAHGAGETRRYAREVADAVTQKAHPREAEPPQSTPAQQGRVAGRTPAMTADAARADSPGRAREQATPPHDAKKSEVKKDLTAI
jgi:gas vesicle protein